MIRNFLGFGSDSFIQTFLTKPLTFKGTHVDVDRFQIKKGIFQRKGFFDVLEDVNSGVINIEQNVFKVEREGSFTHGRGLSKEEFEMMTHSSLVLVRCLFTHKNSDFSLESLLASIRERKTSSMFNLVLAEHTK